MELSVSIGDQDKKRKAKEERRRKAKEERKTKIKEHALQKQLNPEQKHKKQLEQKIQEENKEVLTPELLKEMNLAQKLQYIKFTQKEIIANPDERYRKLIDLIALCSDSKNIDVVIKAVKALCDIFSDILPSYRIREQKTNISEDIAKEQEGMKKGKGPQSKKVSKEVQAMREQESVLLSQYKEYLKILEVFSKTRTDKMIKKQGIEKDDEKKKKAMEIYKKLRELSIFSFCRLLKRHPHFNYRLNILQSVIQKLATNELAIRNEVTSTIFELLKSDDNTLIDFKLEVLKELAKVIKQKQHNKMDGNLLDCLVTHQIIVDEKKAKTIDESSRKIEELKQQMEKLRKKGKFSDYRDMKQQLIQELKESDAIGVDLGTSSKINNLIIKEILGIYFDILKNKNNSPLLKGVFLGLPQFTQYINIEIVWDLINVLREYIRYEFEELAADEVAGQKTPAKIRKGNIQNVLSGLLCAFQIIDVGAGTSFNVEEKDFIDALYAVLQRLIEHPFDYKLTDFLAFAKCMTIVFIARRQYSNELVNAFVKRLALLQMNMTSAEQVGVLFLLKQILTKYPTAKSSMIEIDDEGLANAFAGDHGIYKSDINDPQLTNATQSSIVLELIHTINVYKQRTSDPSYKLAKSILHNEPMPQEFLGLNALQVVKNVQAQQKF